MNLFYYCWAQVCYDKNNSELTPPAGNKLPAKQPEHYNCTKVLPAVMSVGWNPFYNNTTKSMETHLIHDFEEDFYDAVLRVSIVGRLRGEKNYESLQDLIDDINRDIANAQEKLCDDFSNLCYPGSFFYRCCSIEWLREGEKLEVWKIWMENLDKISCDWLMIYGDWLIVRKNNVKSWL